MSASREKKQRQGSAPVNRAEKARQEQQTRQRKTRIYGVVALVAVVLVAALLIWNSGVFQSRATAATVGGETVSVSELSYHYYESRFMYAYYGLIDTSKSDADQVYNADEGTTYQDYFLGLALDSAQQQQALYEAALEAGHSLSEVQEDLDNEIASVKSAAAAYNYSYSAYLKYVYGRYMTPSAFEEVLGKDLLATKYSGEKSDETRASYSIADLEAYYQEHKDEVDVFEFSTLYFKADTVSDTDADGNKRSEEEIEAMKKIAMDAAKAKASSALEAYNNGTSFEDLVEQFKPSSSYDHTTATGVSSISTIYRETLLGLDAEQAGMAEYTDTGYYVVIYHSRARDEQKLATVRHILVRAETTTDENDKVVAPTDEAWNTAKEKAEDILAEYKAGTAGAEAFGKLANFYSDDAGSNTTGGLYSNIRISDSYVTEFKDWIFDENGRNPGDTGLVRHEGDTASTNSYWGYHVMYFQEWGEEGWATDVRSALAGEALGEWNEGLLEKYPSELADGAYNLGR